MSTAETGTHVTRDVIRARHGDPSSAWRAWLFVRSAVFWVWAILLTVTLGGPVLLGSLISFNVAWWFTLLWLKLNVYGLRAICGVNWRVSGMENIPTTPCIVLAKHQSTWDC